MDWGYVAGYFDGEGHVAMHRQRGRSDMSTALVWTNTHEASLVAMREFMGLGRVYRVKTRPIYVLRVARRNEMLRALERMLPHLIIKRERALALKQHLETAPFREVSPNFGKVAATSTEQLQRWYNDEGLSVTAIADRLGVRHSAVSKAFQIRCISRRPRGAHSKGIPKSVETRARMSAAALLREATRRETRAQV